MVFGWQPLREEPPPRLLRLLVQDGGTMKRAHQLPAIEGTQVSTVFISVANFLFKHLVWRLRGSCQLKVAVPSRVEADGGPLRRGSARVFAAAP